MTKQQTSSLFLSNVTLIDAAYIGIDGRAYGLSVSPVFKVSGVVAGDEQVVVDFSKCRKMLKALIDDKEEGFDHKLWVDANVFIHPDVVAGWSLEVLDTVNGAYDTPEKEVHLTTPELRLVCPRNAVRFVNMGQEPNLTTDTYPRRNRLPPVLEAVAKDMGQWLTERLVDCGVTVEVTLPRPTGALTQPAYPAAKFATTERLHFAYTHGLPHSSSWGCQNILHGHTSFIDIVLRQRATESDALFYHHKATDMLIEIEEQINNAYFLDETNYTLKDGAHSLTYTTERGVFILDQPLHTKIIKLPTAPTIENIVEWVATTFARQLEEAGVVTLAVSEGLWKGAVISVPESNWVERSAPTDTAD